MPKAQGKKKVPPKSTFRGGRGKNASASRNSDRRQQNEATEGEELSLEEDILQVLAVDGSESPSSPKRSKSRSATRAGKVRDIFEGATDDRNGSKENTAVKARRPTSKRKGKNTDSTSTDEPIPELAASAKAKGKQKQEKPEDAPAPPVENKADPWDPDYVKQLAAEYPDTNWAHRAAPLGQPPRMLSELQGEDFPRRFGGSFSVGGNIYGLELSPDNSVLAVFGSRPYISLYMALKPFSHIKNLRDEEETQIDDYYAATFSPNCRYIAAGGKHKDRNKWNEDEEDNKILPCPVKIFDVATGKVVARLETHDEEVMSIRGLFFKGDYYYLTTSQDGSIWKWRMEKDYRTLVEKTKIDDNVTCMAFDTSFLPGTGNKYFLAACDGVIMLVDFESAKCLQIFEMPYSEYCENVKFVDCVDLPNGSGDAKSPVPQFAYFVTRGVETAVDEMGTPIKPNCCTLNKLCYPQVAKGEFTCETVRRFEHPSYLSNYWQVRQTSNGRYLLAPQQNGKLACFDLLTGKLVWVTTLQDEPLRRVLFHPDSKLAYAAGDGDGIVHIWGQGFREEEVLPWKAVEGENIPHWALPPPPPSSKRARAGSSRQGS